MTFFLMQTDQNLKLHCILKQSDQCKQVNNNNIIFQGEKNTAELGGVGYI